MIDFLVKRKITTLMACAAVCLWGLISVTRLPVQLMPNIEFSKLTIITSYPNASPSEVEKLVTRKIEEAVSSVNGVKEITSDSVEGVSIVTVQFEWGVNIDLAMIEAKEKVDIAKSLLPQDAGKSVVVKYDPKADPVLFYAVQPKSGSERYARHRVEKELVPYIERVEGVAVVDVSGGLKRQINISIDSQRLFAHSITIDEVLSAIAQSNFGFPSGFVESGNKEYVLKTEGEFENLEQISDVVVGKSESGASIYLKDIATVEDAFKDQTNVIRLNGENAISLGIRKEPGKNVVDISNRLDSVVGELSVKYRNDFTITKIYDESVFVRASISNVAQEAIAGCMIAILVLFLFLKDIRSPFIVISSIPISLTGTFALMYVFDVTLNTMSLGGLALGVGMIVDAGTVVLEAISEGPKTVQNIVQKTARIAVPVLISTLSSIIVFLPIAFVSGVSGAIFRELALTITFSLLISYIAAITVIPMLYSLEGRYFKRINNMAVFRSLSKRSTSGLAMLDQGYSSLLRFALAHRMRVIVAGILVSVAGLTLFAFIDFELMPKADAGEFRVEAELPKGSTLQNSLQVTQAVESALLRFSDIRNVYVKIGTDPDNILERTEGRGANSIRFLVTLREDRSVSTRKLIEKLGKEIRLGEQVSLRFFLKEDIISSLLSSRVQPLNIDIYGDRFDILNDSSRLFEGSLRSMRGVSDIITSTSGGYPEFIVKPDREKMALFGITSEALGQTLKNAVAGEVATKLRSGEDEIDIRARLREEDRKSLESIKGILVKTGNGDAIAVDSVCSITEGASPSKITRVNQSRVATVSASVTGNKRQVYDAALRLVERTGLPEGYRAKVVGEKEEIAASLESLVFALALSIVLIYMLLAAQFQSLLVPLVLMLSIPMATFGVSSLLLLTGKTININSCIGMILLAGNVVNNSIILYDIVSEEAQTGKNVDSVIVHACRRRLSAILNTTLTTILGMLPIAIGFGMGSELQQPLAIAVIGGLTVSTFLTLIYLPVIYSVLHRAKIHG